MMRSKQNTNKNNRNTTSGAGMKNFLKNSAKSFLVNASEETLTEIANIVYDTIALGDISTWERSIAEYMAQGLTESEAKSRTAADMVTQVIAAGVSGGLMGLGFSGGAEIESAVRGRRVGKTVQQAQQKTGENYTQEILETAKQQPETSDAYKLAAQLEASGKPLSKGEIGALVQAIYAENAEAGAELTKDLDAKISVDTELARQKAMAERPDYDRAALPENITGMMSERTLERVEAMRQKGGGFIRNTQTPKTLSSRTARILTYAGRATGATVVFGDESMKGIGVQVGDVIVLNPNSKRPVLDVFAHETTHLLKKTAPEEYAAYEDIVKDILYSKDQKARSAANTIRKAWAEQGISLQPGDVTEEMTAMFTEQLIKSPEQFEDLIGLNRNIWQKIHDVLSEVLIWFRKKLSGEKQEYYQTELDDFYDNAAKYADAEQLEAARRYIQEAINKSAKNKNAAETAAEAKLRIETIPGTDMQYVQADRQVIKGDDPQQWGKQVERYINETVRQGEDVTFPTADGDAVTITEKTAWKMKDRHKAKIGAKTEFLSPDQYHVKTVAAAHIDEMVRTSKLGLV